MIRVFDVCEPSPEVLDGVPANWKLSRRAVWVDLISPTRDEELAVENALGLQVPTREEMAEIEASSRLYRRGGATFATIDLLHHTDSDLPDSAPVTFILSKGPLVTVRYSEPRAFRLLGESLDADPSLCGGPLLTLVSLFEAVIDRTADVIERNAAEVEAVSDDVFNTPGKTNFTRALQKLGRAQLSNARIADSLAGLDRALSFVALDEQVPDAGEEAERLKTLQRDIRSLATHTAGVAQSVNFQLSAALGLINIEQSGIIKIFSVAAVAFLPPTLIASIYGMNFDHMPELNVPWAYPLALVAMVASAILPLVWFRKKGWL